jgi:hypothetical protein
MAGRHGQYPPELRERAVRLVAECRADHDSEWDAMRSVRRSWASARPRTGGPLHGGTAGA